jgi:hypothetical protein
MRDVTLLGRARIAVSWCTVTSGSARATRLGAERVADHRPTAGFANPGCLSIARVAPATDTFMVISCQRRAGTPIRRDSHRARDTPNHAAFSLYELTDPVSDSNGCVPRRSPASASSSSAPQPPRRTSFPRRACRAKVRLANLGFLRNPSAPRGIARARRVRAARDALTRWAPTRGPGGRVSTRWRHTASSSSRSGAGHGCKADGGADAHGLRPERD